MRAPKLLAACLAAAGLMSCLSDSDSTGSVPKEWVHQTGTYRVQGGSLIINVRSPAYRECINGIVVSQPESFQEVSEDFALYPDSLIWFDTPYQTSDKKGFYMYTLPFRRSGKGTGLEGRWIRVGTDFTVISGELSASTRISLEQMSANSRRQYERYPWIMTLSGSSYTITMPVSDRAKDFLLDWNDPIGGIPKTTTHDITLRLAGPGAVELTGRKTGEKVTIQFKNRWDMTYTSSDPAHGKYSFLESPTQCPHDPSPEWYEAFLTGNLRTPVP